MDGIIRGKPVVGRWYADNGGAGQGYYRWGQELINTAPGYLERLPDLHQIKVKVAGHYVIHMNVLQGKLPPGQRGDVHIHRNGTGIGNSLGYGGNDQFYKHVLSVIAWLDAGDQIGIYQATPDAFIYAGNDAWSSLEIYRLN